MARKTSTAAKAKPKPAAPKVADVAADVEAARQEAESHGARLDELERRADQVERLLATRLGVTP